MACMAARVTVTLTRMAVAKLLFQCVYTDRVYCCCVVLHTYTGALALSFAAFGEGTGDIWLDNVNCAGTESRLADCPANSIGVHNCRHIEDAGVRCPNSNFGKNPCVV